MCPRFSVIISPKVPIFSIRAAKTIDPYTGASTWALGSHIWVKYMGDFTKKAKVKDRNTHKLV